jgi:hypothetical protein
MTKYQELENKIEELQAEVERLKQEEKAEQIDLSTCIMGQLVQYRNGNFDYYEYKDEAGFYVVGGDAYCKDGRYYNGKHNESPYDVVKVFPAEIPVLLGFNAFYAKKVLKGDVSALGQSFSFYYTPQGDKYWRDIFTGKTNLSLGDMIFIQKWVIQSP